ncbi:cobalamin-independent methionine synthase II family protein [Pseudonocardia sp. GCM10023141]|uniref:cobalamin-independent methionine synthase II family protein n=1 Tax=Pseudonocardia sp. GCM10023141 TaxID=3252653 RepID=UPI00361213E8
MRVGNQEMLLPTTMVGKYPEPRWWKGQAFARYPGRPGKVVFDAISEESYNDVIQCIARDQERVGLDVVADGRVFDGEDSYGQLLYHYIERLTGYELDGPNLAVPIYSMLYAPTCVGEVRRRYPFHVETLKAMRRSTDRPIKISYTGVGAMTAATNNLYYADIKELGLALAKAINEDLKELAGIGVDVIQLDEFVWPYGMGDWEIDCLNAAIKDVDAQIWLHVCWGNLGPSPAYLPYEGDDAHKELGVYDVARRPRHATDTTERARNIFPKVLGADIDVLNYEVGRVGPDDLKPLADNNWTKPFVAGVIDVKSVVAETAEEVADRIRAVMEYVPIEQLGVTTDCGLPNLKRWIAQTKLTALVEGAEIVRAEHSGS